MKQFIITFLLIMCLPCISFAHQGRTDDAGGHHDYDNESGLGSYHYHHGYEAHLHTDGICQYDYDDLSGYSDSSSSNLYTPFYTSDDDINEVYNDGYDYGYESGYIDSKKEMAPSLAAAFALPTVVASILTFRSNSKAQKEGRSIFQLQQQRRKEEINLETAKKEIGYQKAKLKEEKEKIFAEIETYREQAENAKQAAEDRMRPHLNRIDSQVACQKQEIEKLKAERKRLEDINNGLKKEIEEKNIQQIDSLSHLIPKGTVINADGYPVEITPTGFKGDKYLVVINRNSEVYHHPGCHHAWSTQRVNIVDAQKTHRPCGACKHLLPDMYWYRKYIAEKEKQK